MEWKATALVIEADMSEDEARQAVERLAELPGGPDAIAAEGRHQLERAWQAQAARESRVRRALRRQGLLVRKDQARSVNLDHQGGYTLIDADGNFIVGGERFDLTLDDLEARLRG